MWLFGLVTSRVTGLPTHDSGLVAEVSEDDVQTGLRKGDIGTNADGVGNQSRRHGQRRGKAR